MRIILSFAVIAFCFHGAIHAATVKRCVSADGSVEFTDRPCASEQAQETIDIPDAPKTEYQRRVEENAAADAEREAARVERSKEWDALIENLEDIQKQQYAICDKRIRHEGLEIGMPRAAVLESDLWGAPSDVSTTTAENYYREYFVYNCGEKGKVRMFFVNGRLQSIHD